MVAIALRHNPHAACIVPEKREERTTEGGLDAAGQHNHLAPIVARLNDAGIRVSLFIEPDARQIEAAIRLRAPVVEFHTGRYAHSEGEDRPAELRRIADAAALAWKNGIEPHAGHGLTYDNVVPVAAIPQLAELNIGHYLIGEAIFTGLDDAVRRMRELMDEARGAA
jgi:pyridoxine 5-phosphate synthase